MTTGRDDEAAPPGTGADAGTADPASAGGPPGTGASRAGGARPGEPLWGGRFGTPPAPEARALGRSLAFDVRLAAQDVEASVAHARALEAAGLLTAEEAARLEGALREVGAEIAEGRFAFDPADEDVHSAIERGVTERLGELGARLHAGRSRNDLVATDVRLWMREASRRVGGLVRMLVRTLLARAREHAGTVMPGTTHGRPAQVVTLGHQLLAHAWALLRDLGRLEDQARRAAASPLGAGALATSTLGLDPAATARRLGFDRSFENSIDAVSDRDAVQELLACCAILGTHCSRLAADAIRWSELGWAEVDEAYATGSSMMPQKRNPDVLELARGKAGRLAAAFQSLATVLAGLPLGYHRDLQEDKEPLFDAVDTLELVLPALIGCLGTLRFDPAAMRAAALAPELYATDVAEALVRTGVPFREAHRRVGELLRRLETEGRTLRDLTAAEWAAFGLEGGGALLDPDRSVRARAIPGGPAPQSVLAQVDAIEAALAMREGMGEHHETKVRVVEADAAHDWQRIPVPEGDQAPPGEEVVLFRAMDGRFSVGLWRRAPEEGPMEPPYHEMAILLEGEVELTLDDGTVLRAGPGDVIVAPKGARATWRSLSPVRKFWAIYREPEGAP